MMNAFRSWGLAVPNARASTTGWLLAAAGVLAGCADKPVALGTLYQRLGGEAGVATLVDDLLRAVEQDPRIQEKFAKADAPNLKQTLAAQVCRIGNGPCADQTASVRTTLHDMQLTNEQFDAFIGAFAKTLDEREIGPNTQRELLFPLKAMRGDVIEPGAPG